MLPSLEMCHYKKLAALQTVILDVCTCICVLATPKTPVCNLVSRIHYLIWSLLQFYTVFAFCPQTFSLLYRLHTERFGQTVKRNTSSMILQAGTSPQAICSRKELYTKNATMVWFFQAAKFFFKMSALHCQCGISKIPKLACCQADECSKQVQHTAGGDLHAWDYCVL